MKVFYLGGNFQDWSIPTYLNNILVVQDKMVSCFKWEMEKEYKIVLRKNAARM